MKGGGADKKTEREGGERGDRQTNTETGSRERETDRQTGRKETQRDKKTDKYKHGDSDTEIDCQIERGRKGERETRRLTVR